MDPPQQFKELKRDAHLDEEIETLSSALGRDSKRHEDEAQKGQSKESGQRQNSPKKLAKPQAPPTIAVTPEDKVLLCLLKEPTSTITRPSAMEVSP